MRHYEEPHHRGPLIDAKHRHRFDNPVCGDSVQLELQINAAGIIEQAWFITRPNSSVTGNSLALPIGEGLISSSRRCPRSLLGKPAVAPEDGAYHAALTDLDFWLRADGYRRNPGTTADLIAAGLFILLRDGRLKLH